MRSFFSNTDDGVAGARELLRAGEPRRPRADDRDRLAGPACDAGCGMTQPSSQPLSMIACSIDLMPTGSLLMLSVHASSHGAGQMRPVNSGKLLVECSVSIARFQSVAVDEVVPVRDDVVDRAAAHAERDAAVHAARALDLRLVVARARDELALVLLARLAAPRTPPARRWNSRNPVTLPIGSCRIRRRAFRRGARAHSRAERAPVFVRKHLDELRRGASPSRRGSPARARCRCTARGARSAA